MAVGNNFCRDYSCRNHHNKKHYLQPKGKITAPSEQKITGPTLVTASPNTDVHGPTAVDGGPMTFCPPTVHAPQRRVNEMKGFCIHQQIHHHFHTGALQMYLQIIRFPIQVANNAVKVN